MTGWYVPSYGVLTVAKSPRPSAEIDGTVPLAWAALSTRTSPQTPVAPGVLTRASPALPVVWCSHTATTVPSSPIAAAGAIAPEAFTSSVAPQMFVVVAPYLALTLETAPAACSQTSAAVPDGFTGSETEDASDIAVAGLRSPDCCQRPVVAGRSAVRRTAAGPATV